MNLTLYRTQYLPECTKGNLYIDGNLECFTLEPPLRFNGALNVPDKTCIPEGEYGVIGRVSERFGRTVPSVLAVPGRDNIEIHPLNKPSQTEGCIGVGKTWVDGPAIENSEVAFTDLMEHVQRAMQARESLTLAIYSFFDVQHV